MKRLIVGSQAMLMAFSASAVLVASESFEYPIGPVAGQNGGTGFSGAWVSSSTNNQVRSGSLSAIAFPTSGGRLETHDSTAERTANFTDFHFNVDATNYVSMLVNKGGTGGQSGEYFKAFITAGSASGNIAGFEIGSDEKVKLWLRTALATSAETINVNEDYLFLMKMITSTTSSEQLFLTWYKAGDTIPEDDASVSWKLSTTINNNTIDSSGGLSLETGPSFPM